MITLTPVRSTAVAAIGHDPETQELHVEYASGARYVYPGVSVEHHNVLLAAPSVGSHLNRIVRTLGKPRRLA